MSYRFPLATSSWDDKEHDALQRIIKTGQFSMGAEVAEFEAAFAYFFGARFAIMVNSGSSANLIMVAALFYSENSKFKLSPGDEVIVPAVSWSTTYYPLQQYGLKLKFVDIDLKTLNYDVSALDAAVSESTRAIMIVNLLGNPNDFDAINRCIDGREIVLIEDNCESMGASYRGKKCGTFGAVGSFSSYFSHHISTMEGGVVITDDEELYHIMLSLRSHGWTRNLPEVNKVSGLKSNNPFDESFKFVLPGYNLRPLEMSGALGKEQLLKLPALIKGRRKNGAKFQRALKDHPIFQIQEEMGYSTWFGFSLILRDGSGLTRNECLERLQESSIECRPIVGGNFTNNPVMKYLDYSVSGSLPNAEYVDEFGFFIGNHHYPIDQVFEILSSFR